MQLRLSYYTEWGGGGGIDRPGEDLKARFAVIIEEVLTIQLGIYRWSVGK